MPNKSVTIFLAGHGAVSRNNTIVEDQYLRDHHIVFPAKIQGQLCFVAHNILLQELTDTKVQPYDVLEKVEKYYGISTVNISNGEKAKLNFLECSIDLAKREDRNDLLHLFKTTKSISLLLKSIEAINNDSPNLLLNSDQVEVNIEKLQELQHGVFNEVIIAPHLISFAKSSLLEHSIEKFIRKDTYNSKASILLEHKLASWEQSMEQRPWQKEMPYSPLSNGYEKRTVVNYTPKGKQNELSQQAPEYTGLIFYINIEKIRFDLKTIEPSPSSDEFNKKEFRDGTIYVTTSSESGLLLSDILGFLHKSHVYIVRGDHKGDKDFIGIHASYVAELSKEPEVWDLNNYKNEMTWYDFTIPNDANIVWGACRDLGDF